MTLPRTVIDYEELPDGSIVKIKRQVVMDRHGERIVEEETIASTGTHKALRMEPESRERFRR